MHSYSAALCANFNDTKETNRLTKDSFATLLLSYLCFRAQTTDGVITTTQEALERVFNCGKAVFRKALQKLIKLGVVIIVITTTPKGYKRTAIKVACNENPFFDYEKIRILRTHTNDDELSLLYSFIAYKLNAFDKLNQPRWLKVMDDQVWWQLDIERITEQFPMSERTASRRISKLCELGLLERRRINGVWYCSLEQENYKKISTGYENYLSKKRPSCDFGVYPCDNSEIPSLNNTSTGDRNIYINNNTSHSDIISNNIDAIGSELTKRQAAYLLAAIKITAKKIGNSVYWTIDEIFNWLKFSILNPCQRAGVTGFKHAVNRFIKILREENLMMPRGYNKYTQEGRDYHAWILERENLEKNGRRDEYPFSDSSSVASIAEQSIENCTYDESETWGDLGEIDGKETEVEIMHEGAETRDKRALNEKALRFANSIAEKSADKNANSTILEHLWLELDKCIRQGADLDQIDDIVGHLAF